MFNLYSSNCREISDIYYIHTYISVRCFFYFLRKGERSSDYNTMKKGDYSKASTKIEKTSST